MSQVMSSGMNSISLWIHVPIRRAVANGKAKWGFHELSLQQSEVEAVPPELRDDLATLIELSTTACREDFGEQFIDPEKCMELPSIERGIVDVIAGLRERAKARRAVELSKWRFATPEAAVDETWFFDGPGEQGIKPEVLALRDDPQVAALIKRAIEWMEKDQAATELRIAKGKVAQAGLVEYAKLVPALARAAAEGYQVHEAALEHYIGDIARLDEDVEVLRSDSERYLKSKLEERRAPDERAFETLDRIRAHLSAIRHPDGVEVVVDRIQKIKLAFQEKPRGGFQEKGGKWRLDAPVTVVPVRVDASFQSSTVLIFVAENRQSTGDDIPF